VELLLLRNRENLVKKREEELQRLCNALENANQKFGNHDSGDINQVRKENIKLSQTNLSLLHTVNCKAREYECLKHRNREIEILNEELRRNVAGRNIEIKVVGNSLGKNQSKGAIKNKNVFNITDFNDLLQIQGEIRSDIHNLNLQKKLLDQRCSGYEKVLRSLKYTEGKIDTVEESKAIEISRNRHLVEIEKLQAHQRKLKRENVKFLKKVNDIKALLRTKERDHAEQMNTAKKDLDGRDIKIRDLIKRLKHEKSLNKYLNTRIEEASLLRHELQKEHEQEMLQSNSVIGQLQSRVTELKFSNSINSDHTPSTTSSDIMNIKSSMNFDISSDSNVAVQDSESISKSKEKSLNIDESAKLKLRLEDVRAKTQKIVQQAQSLVSHTKKEAVEAIDSKSARDEISEEEAIAVTASTKKKSRRKMQRKDKKKKK
jgi:hypothetical protein